jgi:hypothetical protein
MLTSKSLNDHMHPANEMLWSESDIRLIPARSFILTTSPFLHVSFHSR